MRVRNLMIVTVACAVAACSDIPSPVASSGRPLTNIADGAHSGGNARFHFLPPLVANPGSGTNVTGLAPVVDICAWNGFSCTASLAHFTIDRATTTTTHPGNSETVRQSGNGYIVNWHTGGFDLATGGIYRICVSVNSHSLGHADVIVVGSGKDLKDVDENEFVGLVDGRTLPIKFRIEDGASSETSDAGCGSGAE